jgi:catechol 2,3-dioxygenase-like lactoylglutathione lyase family enzyme
MPDLPNGEKVLPMIMNHLNLTVTDAAETARFLEKYFGLRGMEGVEPKTTFAMLRDDNGLVLTLIRASRDTEVVYPATFHIGFIQESEARVNEINQRLKEDGYEVPPPARFHGSWTFYFTAPGGFTIEVLG